MRRERQAADTAFHESSMRTDHRIILDMVSPASRVLDLGCGDGELLALLSQKKRIVGQGVEIDSTNVSQCLQKGMSVIHGDLDHGLTDYAEQSFDYVILSQTLQALRRPDHILDEVVRVGKTGIVSFPNFGHWSARFKLAVKGRMPVTSNLPDPWYASPNIHIFTIKDFIYLCRAKGIAVKSRFYIRGDRELGSSLLYNLRADQAIFAVSASG
ncbi:MAG: methionine biosynthesis protein MetW [bacterium]